MSDKQFFIQSMDQYKSDESKSNVFYAMQIQLHDGEYPEGAEVISLDGEKLLWVPDEVNGHAFVEDNGWLICGKSGGYGAYSDELFHMVFEFKVTP